ncbi:hypothetical protein BC936DRAFT_140319 [Jimgerdemannia flammicorona]|uniref:Uncharacterized protein n=1 Tax=Jimgerdemannia flammicorona TaxID=994334 RepID=A0A433DGZ2_9FUNG|nr:hypothetical protein BC936DRAFT_140319 [Jimgerdemannia flammicorona]
MTNCENTASSVHLYRPRFNNGSSFGSSFGGGVIGTINGGTELLRRSEEVKGQKRPHGTIHGDENESNSDESPCESAKKQLTRELRKTQPKGMRISEMKENDELQISVSESDVKSGSEYNPQDIFVDENMDENEPRFILKLRKVMDTLKKSTNPVDKTLAQLGILRLSSRQKIYEPSTMRAEAVRALSEQEKAELKTFTEIPAVMGVPVFEGNTLNDRWRNLSSFTSSTTVERTTLRLHELFLTGLEGNEALRKVMNERTFTAKYIVPLNAHQSGWCSICWYVCKSNLSLYPGNYAFSQAMCALAPDIYVMWEWGANILPRSLQQMVYLDKTIRSVYAMKEIWLETKNLLCKAQREASITITEDYLSGCSSPIKPDDGPWKALFHS